MAKYGFSTTLDVKIDEAVERVSETLQKEGFGILSDIDVAGTLKRKLDHDHRPYRILGACNPGFAEQAIEAEPDIGLLLPCNVVVREEADGRTTVAFMDPVAVLGIVDNRQLENIGREVRSRLERACEQLQGA